MGRFDDKRVMKLINVTGSCPFSFEDRVFYSHLVAVRQRTGGGCRPAAVATETGLQEAQTVPACRKRLEDRGLVEQVDGMLCALLPESRRGWFHFFDSKFGTEWHSFQYTKSLVPSADSPLTWRQTAILGLLYSYARKAKNRVVKGLSLDGIATQVPASKTTVKAALDVLKERKLISIHPSRDGKRYAYELLPVGAGRLRWFRDTDEARYQDDAEYPTLPQTKVSDESSEVTFESQATSASVEVVENEVVMLMTDLGISKKDQQKLLAAGVAKDLSAGNFLKMVLDAERDKQKPTCVGLLLHRIGKLKGRGDGHVSNAGRRKPDRGAANHAEVRGVPEPVPGDTDGVPHHGLAESPVPMPFADRAGVDDRLRYIGCQEAEVADIWGQIKDHARLTQIALNTPNLKYLKGFMRDILGKESVPK